jgi:hypothetical protein
MSGLASVSCDDEQSSTSATPFQFQKPTAQRAALHQTLAGLQVAAAPKLRAPPWPNPAGPPAERLRSVAQATTLRKRVQKAERGGLKARPVSPPVICPSALTNHSPQTHGQYINCWGGGQ